MSQAFKHSDSPSQGGAGCGFFQNFENVQKIGSGGFGFVVSARKIGEKTHSALKFVPIDGTNEKKTLEEAEKLSRITPHPSVIRCIDFWKESFSRRDHKRFMDELKPNKEEAARLFPSNLPKFEFLCIRMELCGNGNLRKWLKSRVKVDSLASLTIFAQSVRGTAHLHEHGLIHRDIKPANILFNGKVAKISDLGYSVTHNQGEYNHTQNAGAALYQAPEQAIGQYGPSVDYYALGLILFELFYPAAQTNVGETLLRLKFSRPVPAGLKAEHPEVVSMIEKLISYEPKDRPDRDQILKDIKRWEQYSSLTPEKGYGPAATNLSKDCNRCTVSLLGVRYKCTICVNYWLCEDCEIDGEHPVSHDMLKIKTPLPEFSSGTGTQESVEACEHYRRRCLIQCSAKGCERFFPCRLCHDEAIKGHKLNRHDVKLVQCIACNMKQYPNEMCFLCGTRFAKYVCVYCNLYDDAEDAERLNFHCFDCGICRRRANEFTEYEHCAKCSMCYPTSTGFEGCRVDAAVHVCEQDAGKKMCSVCGKSLHDSRDQAVLADCHHYVHITCRLEFPEGVTKCPTCGSW